MKIGESNFFKARSFKKNTIPTSYYEHIFLNVILVQIAEESVTYGKNPLFIEIHKPLYSLNIDR